MACFNTYLKEKNGELKNRDGWSRDGYRGMLYR